jgi:hypothetical protein
MGDSVLEAMTRLRLPIDPASARNEFAFTCIGVGSSTMVLRLSTFDAVPAGSHTARSGDVSRRIKDSEHGTIRIEVLCMPVL